jgi:abhydrolase domain-containing protein 4
MSPSALQRVLSAQRALLVASGVNASLAESGSRRLRLPTLGCTLNAFVMPPPAVENPPALLMLHGWGAGLATWGFALPTLSRRFRVVCVDLPGMGGHDRCPFPAAKDGPDASVDFFTSHLQDIYTALDMTDPAFRAAAKHLVAHSLGAAVSVYWELKAPGKFRTIVLASPAGVPERPAASASLISSPVVRNLVFKIWESDTVSPQWLMRMLPTGFVLSKLKEYYSRGFGHLYSGGVTSAMAEYFYSVSTAGKRSSEMAFSTLLLPGAWARRPIGVLMRQVKTPVAFCYGDRDWMDASAGEVASKSMSNARSTHVILSGADHNLMMSEPTQFANFVIDFCLDERRMQTSSPCESG